jgi:hypothetical protein
MKKQENKLVDAPNELVIEGSINYKLTISKEGYELETSNTINNDIAAMLHSRGVVEMIKKDSEMTKKSPMFKMFDTKQKKMFNDRYDKLIHAAYILEKLSGELLTKAMIANDKKDS